MSVATLMYASRIVEGHLAGSVDPGDYQAYYDWAGALMGELNIEVDDSLYSEAFEEWHDDTDHEFLYEK